jgi:WD40 repeat protein
MSRSRRIVAALFALLAVGLVVSSVIVWESFQPTVIELAYPVEALALSADGESIAACGSDLTWIYTTHGGERGVPKDPELDQPLALQRVKLAFSDAGDFLYGVDSSGRVKRWSRRDGSDLGWLELKGSGPVAAVGLLPRGDLLATRSETPGLQLWALPEGRLVRDFPREWTVGLDYRIGFSPSGGLVYVWAGVTDRMVAPGGITVWSVRDRRLVFAGRNPVVTDTVLDPGELYVAYDLNHTGIVELRTDRERYRFDDVLPMLAVSRDGELLAVGAESVDLRSAADGRVVRRLRVHEPEPCMALAFSADRSRLAAAFGRRIYAWRLRH